mmetsp:Transcript_25496/g.82382  ORF Transcript_25496/g.82382 Transcript_25496/m.82382 type:complete len:212 (+) Transcript_25496:294-929(+)|eukprot:scaffold4766_cov115-Isochrysis_galbana.AAC.6
MQTCSSEAPLPHPAPRGLRGEGERSHSAKCGECREVGRRSEIEVAVRATLQILAFAIRKVRRRPAGGRGADRPRDQRERRVRGKRKRAEAKVHVRRAGSGGSCAYAQLVRDGKTPQAQAHVRRAAAPRLRRAHHERHSHDARRRRTLVDGKAHLDGGGHGKARHHPRPGVHPQHGPVAERRQGPWHPPGHGTCSPSWRLSRVVQTPWAGLG